MEILEHLFSALSQQLSIHDRDHLHVKTTQTAVNVKREYLDRSYITENEELFM